MCFVSKDDATNHLATCFREVFSLSSNEWLDTKSHVIYHKFPFVISIVDLGEAE